MFAMLSFWSLHCLLVLRTNERARARARERERERKTDRERERERDRERVVEGVLSVVGDIRVTHGVKRDANEINVHLRTVSVSEIINISWVKDGNNHSKMDSDIFH